MPNTLLNVVTDRSPDPPFDRRENDHTSFYEYVAARVGPSISLLALFGAFAMFFIGGMGIFAGFGSHVSVWLQILPLVVILPVAWIARKPRAPAVLRVLSLSCICLLEIEFNLQGMNTDHGLPWVWPATLLVPVAATIAWIDPRDFTWGMALCSLGPAPMLWLVAQQGVNVLQYAVYMVVAVSLSMVLRAFIRRMLINQFSLERQLREQATTDGLSGLLSRNCFLQRAADCLDGNRLQGTHSCMLYLDADNFKGINDGYGHAAGDVVLVALAAALREHTRHTDLIGRIGGEEFAIFLPGAGLERAHGYAENIRRAAHSIRRPDGWLTISIGIAHSTPDDTDGLEQILANADNAMLQAKAGGRDRVVVDQAASASLVPARPALQVIESHRAQGAKP